MGQLGGIPYNVPLPKGKSVKMWSFADANLMHRFAQPFPKENCKRKGSDCDTSLLLVFQEADRTVNTATYGAEGDGARTASRDGTSSPSCTLEFPLMDLHYYLV